MKKKRTDSDKPEFSKKLLLQESMLIWIITISFIILAFVCVSNQFFGELPWLAAMCAFPWTAYGASQAFYFRKAERENTKGGIKYETVMADYHQDIPPEEFDESANG
jgi:EamA domain-containing membrane protein RarD